MQQQQEHDHERVFGGSFLTWKHDTRQRALATAGACFNSIEPPPALGSSATVLGWQRPTIKTTAKLLWAQTLGFAVGYPCPTMWPNFGQNQFEPKARGLRWATPVTGRKELGTET